ncbi:30S ribosomal protein S6 [Membranihabitans marinus]|uniref:30S ribosomal protein S6 n=1 Tax=Membranihabitans marinus TaxID=1227546 RepID=UPI001F01FCA3|nr:30S ribosomal protein S6 [Membranihabitans marinus]
MRTYEVTFIVDPVLSNDEIKATASNYSDHLKNENCQIVAVEDMGLKPLAYPIAKRSTGAYFSIEFNSENGEIVKKIELAMKRDERVIRHLIIKLEKFGVKYNDDKRKGLIGKKSAEKSESKEKENA